MERLGEYRSRNREIHPPAFFPDYKTSVARSPRKPLIALQQSLSEVTGPVFGQDMLQPLDNDLLLNGKINQEPVGERIIVHGRVLDGNARPVAGVLVEFWLTGTHKGPLKIGDKVIQPTGRAFKVRMAATFEFKPNSDRILCERPYFDQMAVLKAIGVA